VRSRSFGRGDAIPGVVFAGAYDGKLRAFDTANGRVLWQFDTNREFTTVGGGRGHGGSIEAAGPVVIDGAVLVTRVTCSVAVCRATCCSSSRSTRLAMKSLADFDLMNPATQSCPYDFYSRLRHEAPIYRMPGTGFHLVTSFELAREVIRQPDLFASGVSPWRSSPAACRRRSSTLT
jgi:hypothetical protein